MTTVIKEVSGVYTWLPEEVYDTKGPCPEGFHVPTQTEWIGLFNLGITIGAWISTSDTTHMTTYLHMPLAGYRYALSSAVMGQGEYGYYWSSTAYSSNYQSYALELTSSSIAVQYLFRASGFPIRAFKNTFVAPTSSWTTIYQGTGSAGIFWNQTDGIISITSDGITGYTIQDKNLGATTVFNYGDTQTAANCGYYYQRGNNYGFAGIGGSVSTSSTKVNASTYGPGNYYSSSNFITGGAYWDSSDNDNLWGGA